MIGQYAKYNTSMEAIITETFDEHIEIYFKYQDSRSWERRILETSLLGESIQPIFKDGKPVMVKKTIFGNVKYLK